MIIIIIGNCGGGGGNNRHNGRGNTHTNAVCADNLASTLHDSQSVSDTHTPNCDQNENNKNNNNRCATINVKIVKLFGLFVFDSCFIIDLICCRIFVCIFFSLFLRFLFSVCCSRRIHPSSIPRATQTILLFSLCPFFMRTHTHNSNGISCQVFNASFFFSNIFLPFLRSFCFSGKCSLSVSLGLARSHCNRMSINEKSPGIDSIIAVPGHSHFHKICV